MRIIIEPTDLDSDHDRVAVETPRDDLNIYEMMARVRTALIAWGYAERTVDEALAE